MADAAELARLAGVYITSDRTEQATMVAIALAESGGNERAHNSNPATRDDSYGVWQINMYGTLGPSRRSQYGLTANTELFDPNINARIAGDIYRSRGKGQWGSYTNGSYRQHLPAAEAAVGGTTGSGGLGGAVDLVTNPTQLLDVLRNLNPLDSMNTAITVAIAWLGDAVAWFGDSHNWIRILEVAGGIVLANVAISIVLRPAVESRVKTAVSVASKRGVPA